MLPLLPFRAGTDAETGGALVEWFMLVVGKKVVHNGEGALNDGPTDNVAGSTESEDEEVGTSPNCGASMYMHVPKCTQGSFKRDVCPCLSMPRPWSL